jgi:Cellulose binding domain
MKAPGSLPAPVSLWALALVLGAAAFVAGCSSGGGKPGDAGTDVAGDATDGGSEPVVDGPVVDGPVVDGPVVDTDADVAIDSDALPSDADGPVGETDASDGDALPSDADGAAGDASRDGALSDAGDAGQTPCPTCRLYPLFTPTGQSTTQTGPGMFRFEDFFGITLVNGSDDRVSIDKIEVRYWFTGDGAVNLNVSCGGNCGRVAGATFVPVSPRAGADNYFSLTFQSGALDAFSDTGLIQNVLAGQTNGFFIGATLILDDDYSFAADPTQPDPRITIYDSGKLVWGTEPK